mgnify:CR=1 FL=1
MIYQEAVPNIAHKILAKLKSLGKVKAIITQNIDGLHQLAGSNTYCFKADNGLFFMDDFSWIFKTEIKEIIKVIFLWKITVVIVFIML